MRLLRRCSRFFTPSFPRRREGRNGEVIALLFPNFYPVIPAIPRHSRESGNPEGWERRLCTPLPLNSDFYSREI